MTKIQIRLEHGRVTMVENVPEDVSLEILEYDIDKYQRNELPEGETGKPCEIREWRTRE
jgi:hypothetical protein